MIYLGADPGSSSGAIAFINSNDGLLLHKMPHTERDIFDTLKDITDDKECTAVIEKVHSMPGQGVSSSFKFGMNYGHLTMALTALAIPFEEVTPQKWMSHFGMKRKKGESKTAWKHRLKRKAQQMFPDVDIPLQCADSLLLAEYCRQSYVEQNKDLISMQDILRAAEASNEEQRRFMKKS